MDYTSWWPTLYSNYFEGSYLVSPGQLSVKKKNNKKVPRHHTINPFTLNNHDELNQALGKEPNPFQCVDNTTRFIFRIDDFIRGGMHGAVYPATRQSEFQQQLKPFSSSSSS